MNNLSTSCLSFPDPFLCFSQFLVMILCPLSSCQMCFLSFCSWPFSSFYVRVPMIPFCLQYSIIINMILKLTFYIQTCALQLQIHSQVYTKYFQLAIPEPIQIHCFFLTSVPSPKLLFS